MKLLGIYKVTSPNGRIYVGQSIDIDNRINGYKKLQNCSGQPKLYRSFIKHGVNNHKFDVIELCNIQLMNERERFWQDHYDACGRNGLNCRLTVTSDKSGFMSIGSRVKMSNSSKGKKKGPLSVSTKAKMSEAHIGHKYNLGRKASEESKIKIRFAKKRGNHHLAKKVVNTKTNDIYDCMKDAAESIGMNYITFYSQITGRRKNKTNMILTSTK